MLGEFAPRPELYQFDKLKEYNETKRKYFLNVHPETKNEYKERERVENNRELIRAYIDKICLKASKGQDLDEVLKEVMTEQEYEKYESWRFHKMQVIRDYCRENPDNIKVQTFMKLVNKAENYLATMKKKTKEQVLQEVKMGKYSIFNGNIV